MQGQVKNCQIEEKKASNKQKLNIKIPEFKGYDSTLDIYTFKSKFEKVHLKDTPMHLLPDLLKNNFLEGPALLVVNDLQDINEIWKQLKESFRDCKLMLSKKLNLLNSIDLSRKQKDSSKLIDGLSKLVNLMKDLRQLATQHNIQSHLYYGDTLERIYQMMGEDRMRRWLSQDSIPDDGEPLWTGLIAFLEKELKVCQQTSIMMGKHKEHVIDPKSQGNRESSGDSNRDKTKNRNSTHLTNLQKQQTCFIWSGNDHVATNGPGGSKLIQNFVCPRFASMTNKERFEELRAKGFCWQCLFPGASKDSGNHKDGKCQRDFVCKHSSHEKFQKKKHVLVCDEHKDN